MKGKIGFIFQVVGLLLIVCYLVRYVFFGISDILWAQGLITFLVGTIIGTTITIEKIEK